MFKVSSRLAVPVALSAAFAIAAPAYGQSVLTAAKVAEAPKLAALAADPAWSKASELKFTISGGRNFDGGKSNVALKAVYTADSLYLLLQYDDPTQSVRRSPFVKQPDGSWKKLSDPDDKGGDNNLYYEDKFAFIWNIDNSIKNFDRFGCMATCHVGEPGKPYGNKYTASAGELGDIWHMKSVRGGYIGQVDNQYVDDTRFDKDKAPEAGRKSDAKTGGGYADIKLVSGKPEFMSKDGKAANKGGLYYLKDGPALMRACQELMDRNIQTQGEFFLADVFNLMLDVGARFKVKTLDVWKDCGKPETVLETNRYLLAHGHDNSAQTRNGSCIIIPPVNIHPSAELVCSVIGPDVTIGAGCHIEYSIVRDSIIDEGANICNALLEESLVGKQAQIEGRFRKFNLGDSTVVGFS